VAEGEAEVPDQLEPDVDGALGAGATVMEDAMDSDFTCKGAVTRLLEGGGIEIDGRVVVVPQVLLGFSVRVGDQVELTRVRQKSGGYISVVRFSADPNTIVGERVRVNGDWAPAAEVEADLVQMLGPEIAAQMMKAARENAKLTDEEIEAAVSRMWDEVLHPAWRRSK
jgi:hypothetical protein